MPACAHIFKSGRNEGKNCEIKAQPGKKYCKKHVNSIQAKNDKSKVVDSPIKPKEQWVSASSPKVKEIDKSPSQAAASPTKIVSERKNKIILDEESSSDNQPEPAIPTEKTSPVTEKKNDISIFKDGVEYIRYPTRVERLMRKTRSSTKEGPSGVVTSIPQTTFKIDHSSPPKAGPAPSSPEQTETETQDKSEVEDVELQIKEHYISFPYLQEILPEKDRGEASASEWLGRMKGVINREPTVDFGLFGAGIFMSFIEGLACSKGWRMQGWKDEVMANPQMKTQMLRLVTKYNITISNIEPEWWILLLIGAGGYNAHLKNKFRVPETAAGAPATAHRLGEASVQRRSEAAPPATGFSDIPSVGTR